MNKENRLIYFALGKAPGGEKSDSYRQLDTKKIAKREAENARRRETAEAARKTQVAADTAWSQMQIDEAASQKREKVEIEALEKKIDATGTSQELVKEAKSILGRPGKRGKFDAIKGFLEKNGGEKKEVKFDRVSLRLNEKGEIIGKSGMRGQRIRNDEGIDRFARMNM